MPLTQPIAPESPHEMAFRVVVGTLKADPMLRARNIKWAYWSSDRDDVGTEFGTTNPPESACPFIRLTPLASGRAERRGTDGLTTDYLVPLSVQISTLVASSDRKEAFGLATMILGALFPRDRDERQKLDDRWRSVGVSDVFLRRAILPVDFYSHFIASEGEIELWQFMRL